MSLKNVSISLFIGIFSLFSMYSSEPKSMADVIKKHANGFESTNGDEPKFVYKYKGLVCVWPRRQVEKYMSALYWMSPIVGIDAFFAGAYCMSQEKTFLRENFTLLSAALLVVTGICYVEMKKFQNQAGPWLRALKEKESSSENQN